MNCRLEIRSDALADIEAAAAWYENRQTGLGTDFVRAIRRCINFLAEKPLAFRLRDHRRNVRWFLVPRFPYRVVYRVKDESVTVIAVLHSSRHDREWKKRP